jgi:hypothetical protein
MFLKNRPVKRVPAKDSHFFELPRSQYLENQSSRSKRSVMRPQELDGGNSTNEETNDGSTAAATMFSPSKKTVSWE